VPGETGQNSMVDQRATNITVLQAKLDSLWLTRVSDWNPQTNVFYGNLFFELWIYNSTISDFQYHERYVDLKFNMTST
jgi:hypothetical protein